MNVTEKFELTKKNILNLAKYKIRLLGAQSLHIEEHVLEDRGGEKQCYSEEMCEHADLWQCCRTAFGLLQFLVAWTRNIK